MARVGIIGGTGLYDMETFTAREEVRMETPFGAPSDAVILGKIRGNDVAFISRHGRGHRLLPSEVPYRANIWALKMLGCERVVSVSAVGSMKESIKPGMLVFAHQFIDRTWRRDSTFFGDGVVAHVAFADPVCPVIRNMLAHVARIEGFEHQDGGTYLCMEGPQFSTFAESMSYRALGIDVIGMTNLPEAKLAREAELCYATIALATDYDCWNMQAESVTVEAVVRTLEENVSKAKRVLEQLVPALAVFPRNCACKSALKNAIQTDPKAIPEEARRRLGLLIGKYLN
jgi:5'-methylthioadenosine phosphorylase